MDMRKILNFIFDPIQDLSDDLEGSKVAIGIFLLFMLIAISLYIFELLTVGTGIALFVTFAFIITGAFGLYDESHRYKNKK